jgi:hypothetical protein
MRRTISLEWKTCSVEAGAGFSKPTRPTLPEAAWPKRSGFSGFDSGMQKDGLTMFPFSCYICKVPRVNPGLLCAVSSGGGVRELAVELLRNAFPERG